MYDYVDGALTRDGDLYTNFLFLLAIGIIVVVLPFLYTLYLLVKFKKEDGIKFLNKSWCSLLIGSQSFNLVTLGLGWMFFYGEFIFGTGEDAGRLGFSLVLTFIVITFALAIGWYLLIWLLPQYMWISINDSKIYIMTAEIKKEKIETIVKDESAGKVYINYLESKKNLKKLTYSLSSTMGQFILQEIDNFGVKLTIGDQQEIFKERVVELKTINLEKMNSLKNKETSKIEIKPLEDEETPK